MEIESNKGLETVEPTSIPQTSLKFDLKRVIKLVLNPLESLKLSEKDFLYGIIGLASSYVGFLLWSLLVTNRLNDLLNPYFDFVSLFTEQSRAPEFFSMFSKLMLTGLWSTIALLAVVWLASWWASGLKPEIKTFLTRIGGIHYIACVGYLLASILSINFTLSIIIIVITLLTLLMLTLYAGAELYEVSPEKLSRYFIITVAGYILLFTFIPQQLF